MDTEQTMSQKAGKLTKRLVKLGKTGVNKTKKLPGKTAATTKKSVQSFKDGYKSA